MFSLKKSMITLSVSIATLFMGCGGGSSSSSNATEIQKFIKATLENTDGNFTWELKQSVALKVIDQEGKSVTTVTCKSDDETKLSIEGNCSHITIHRLGASSFTVSNTDNLQSKVSVNGVPTNSPLAVNAGGSNSINQIVDDSKNIIAWGDNGLQQLAINGMEQISYSQYPASIVNTSKNVLSDLYQLAHSYATTYALNSKGEVYGWGNSINKSTSSNSTVVKYPELVRGISGENTLSNIVRIAVSSNFDGVLGTALGITDEGKVLSWGSEKTPLPELVLDQNNNPITDIRSIAASSEYAYAVNTDGQVYQWRLNPFQSRNFTLVKDISGNPITNITKIISNGNRTLALTKDGQIYAWGYASGSNLGDPQFDSTSYKASIADKIIANQIVFASQVKSNVQPLSHIKDIAMNALTSYALTENGNVYAWGSNLNGALGTGVKSYASNSTATPTLVADETGQATLSNVAAITGSLDSIIALKSNGTLVGWGSNQFGLLTQDKSFLIAYYPIAIQKSKGMPFQLDLSKYTKIN